MKDEVNLKFQLESFFLNKEDLIFLWELFEKRLNDKWSVTVEESNSRGSSKKKFTSIEELLGFLKNTRNSDILEINYIGYNPENEAWAGIRIDLNYQMYHYFAIQCGIEDRDWAEGFYSEIESYFKKKYLKEKDLEIIKGKYDELKHKENIIILDLEGAQKINRVDSKATEDKNMPIIQNQHIEKNIVNNGVIVEHNSGEISHNAPEKIEDKQWYEKPPGIIILMVVAGGLIYYFGWN